MTTSKEETKALMEMLLETARKIREGYKYSEDEKMTPTAIIMGEETVLMALMWKDNKEKYMMAAAANAQARVMKARSLSFATDARWVKSDVFSEYYRLDKPTAKNIGEFRKHYHRILAAHGGEIKNLPREVWQEAVVVFTNGPGIPISIMMAPYEEGPDDTIRWLPVPDKQYDRCEYDMLTDWWN
jgi:hypothetical protein